MSSPEPAATAWLLATAGLLLAASAVLSRTARRTGVPVALFFLAVGMLAGGPAQSLGLGLAGASHRFAFRLGTVTLVLTLFDGGLNTPLDIIRTGLRPALLLATAGVAITAALLAAFAYSLGFNLIEALLLGAIVSSTDAAAVFATLRHLGLRLRPRVGAAIELESSLNDPMAVILTTSLTASLLTGALPGPMLLPRILLELAVGAALGFATGYLGRWLLQRAHPFARGIYPVLTVAVAFAAWGLATLAHGSGFLAVYIAAVLVGNARIGYRSALVRFHDSLAWFSQIVMFLMLGLLVRPSHLITVAPVGIALGLFLAFVARPLAVVLCLLPLRYSFRESLFIGWVGLRGAVPVILATIPVLVVNANPADPNLAALVESLFDVVFFVVVVSAIVPGSTVARATRLFRFEARQPPEPEAVVEVHSTRPLNGELTAFYIEPASAVCGSTIADLPLPPGSSAIVLIRGHDLLAPEPQITLHPGDHVYVFCSPADRPFIHLLFGRSGD